MHRRTLAYWTLDLFRGRRSLYRNKQKQKAGIQQLSDVFLWWTSSRSRGVPMVYLISGVSLQNVLGWCSTIATDIHWYWNHLKLEMIFVFLLKLGAICNLRIFKNRSQAKTLDLMVCLLLSWDTFIKKRTLRLCIETILQALDLYFPCSDTQLEWMSWVINMPWGRCRQGVMDNDKDIICKRWCSANGKLVVRVGGLGLKPPTQTTN